MRLFWTPENAENAEKNLHLKNEDLYETFLDTRGRRDRRENSSFRKAKIRWGFSGHLRMRRTQRKKVKSGYASLFGDSAKSGIPSSRITTTCEKPDG